MPAEGDRPGTWNAAWLFVKARRQKTEAGLNEDQLIDRALTASPDAPFEHLLRDALKSMMKP